MTKKKKKKKQQKKAKKSQKKAKKSQEKTQELRNEYLNNSLSITDLKKSEADRPLPSVVHHIRGRIRFRIARLKDDAGYAESLQQFLLAQSGIRRVRVNPVAASVAIAYYYQYFSFREVGN